MDVSFSAAKDRMNQRKHGLSLRRAEDFDFDRAIYLSDTREDYGEERWNAVGFLGMSLYTLTFVYLEPQRIRAISLRRSSTEEEGFYVE